jgi:hypothetical protein
MALIAGRMRLRVRTAGTVRRTISLRVLRDRPYLTIAGLNALLTVHMPLLSIGLPLWIADHSHAPRAIVAPLIAVNTVLAVAFQMRASRGSDTTGGAARCLRLAGFALAACCLILAVVPGLPRAEAVVVLVLAVVALTAGELFQSAGGWGLSYELAVEHQQGAYLSVFWLGVGAQQIAAPLFLGLILSTGPIGWVVLAVLLVAAGLAVPRVTRWAVAVRARVHVS